TLGNAEGLSSQALQQGGIGLFMTVLIITVPTLAAAVWQGNMSNFMHFSAFGGGAASSPGPQGQPVGSYMPQQAAKGGEQPASGSPATHNTTTRIAGAAPTQATQPVGSRGQAGTQDI
ncbi:Type IV secretion system protein virB6, partial [Xanthomonas cucurbitae]